MIGHDALLRYAEDHFLHGHLLASWIVDYVDLEESLAVGSISQEELAHAATFVDLAGYDLVARDRFVYERPLAEWWPASLVRQDPRDWPSTVLRGLLMAAAGMTWTRAVAETDDQRVHDAATTMLAEQSLHLTHWATWLRLLTGDQRTAEEFARTAAVVLPLAPDLFGAAPGMPSEPDRRRLHESFVAELRQLLTSAGLDADLLGSEPTARTPGGDGGDVDTIVSTIRMLRVGPDDGVRAVYR